MSMSLDKNMLLKTSEIRNALSNHARSNRMNTVEVCASNELPLVELKHSKPSAFIVNTDPNFKSGSHWIAIFLPGGTGKNTIPEFFDPLGKPPSAYGSRFIRFLRLNAHNSYIFNRTKFQRDRSTSCGFYACFYIFKRMESVDHENVDALLWNLDEKEIISSLLPFFDPSHDFVK